MLQRAHQQQQMVLRKYQLKIAKMKALEDAVRQQEKVRTNRQEEHQPGGVMGQLENRHTQLRVRGENQLAPIDFAPF